QFNFFASRYYLDINNVGQLHISKITDQFVAGTFEFTAVNEQGKIITISEGRFDVEFR
ncbi:MAG: putative RNA-binding protein with RPS1 domain, partial [Bacteroidia bacterium]